MIKYRNIDKLLLIVLIVLIVSMAFVTSPFLDDFCMNRFKFQNRNIFLILKDLYIVKEGRFMSLIGFFQVFGFKYLSMKTMSIIWSIMFISMTYLISLFIDNRTENKYYKFLLVLIVTLICSEGVINEVVFWPTGGSAYSVGSFFSIFFLYLFIKSEDKFRILFLTPLVITLGPNYSIPIFFIITIELLLKLNINNYKKNLVLFSLYFIVFLAGIIFLLKSPGTQIRLKTVSSYWIWHPKFLIEAFLRILFISFNHYKVLSALTVIILYLEFKHFANETNPFYKKLFLFIGNIKYFLAALVSVFVFIKNPGLLSSRAGFFFNILIIVQFFHSIRNIDLKYFIKYNFIASCILILIIGRSVYILNQFDNRFQSDMHNQKVSKAYFVNTYIYNNIDLPFKRFPNIKKDSINIFWASECYEEYLKNNKILKK